MSQTYSTRQRELVRGQLFSTLTVPAAPPPVPTAAAPAATPASPAAVVPEPHFTYLLTSQGAGTVPGLGAGAAGTVVVTGRPGAPYRVNATLTGLNPPADPALQPTLWLLHDLLVPADLAPADLALLPRGAAMAGNRPGTVFTFDGNPPTHGRTPPANTVTVAISPGRFTHTGERNWELTAVIDAETNQSFHPLVLLGPVALADINVPMPSGTVARILTDMFMRPATVHPELQVRTHQPQRLATLVRDVAAAGGSPAYLDGAQFTRAAVTLEGIVRGTPRLMPTRDACLLVAPTRTVE